MTPRQEQLRYNCQADLDEICRERGYNKWLLIGRSKLSEYVKQRRVVIRELRELGYSYPVIGDVMNRKHEAIIYLDRRNNG